MDNEFKKFWKENYSLESIQKGNKGIKLVIGFPKGSGNSEIQSVLFDNDKWTASEAGKWLKDHDMKNLGVDETENTLRFRQEDPSKYSRMRTVEPGVDKAEYDTYEGGEGGNVDSNSQPHKPLKASEKTPNTAKSKGVNLEMMFRKTGGAPFKILIEKAIVAKGIGEGLPDKLIIEGLATTVNVDHDQERMAPEAVKAMTDCINDKGVPLLSEHDKGWDSYLGKVFKAEMDSRHQMKIWAELDKDYSKAVDLYKALKKGVQFGLSIAGVVKRAALEMVEGLGRKVKTFYDVALKEVSVTNRPSNFDTWLIAKGNYKGKKGGLYEKYVSSELYQEYLSANPAFDWQCAIAKSISEKTLEVDLSKKSKNAQKNNMNIKDLEKKALEIAEKSIKEAFKEIGESEDTTSDVGGTDNSTAEEKAVEAEETETKESETEETTDETINETKTKEKEVSEETSEETSETKETESSSSADTSDYGQDTETNSETKASAKKAVPAKKAVAAKEETEESDSSETESSTKKSKEDYNIDVAVQKFRKALETDLQKSGNRIVGNVSDELIKSYLEQPQEKKGRAIVVEKNGEKVDSDEEVQKDLKDEKMTFQDYFKKNLASVNR